MTSLSEALSRQQQQLTTLQQCLESELHLISSRDAESLIALIDQKAELLDHIQQLDTEIQTSIENSPSLTEADDELIRQCQLLVDDCRYKTQINQIAVEQGQLRLEHLRNLLVESRAKESMTYDKSGKTAGGGKGSGISA